MSQHDYNLANAAGAAFRTDLNNVLSAIISSNSGTAEPATMIAYQFWADTTNGLLKIRNAANTAWVTVGTLATIYLGLASVGAANLFTKAQSVSPYALTAGASIATDASLSNIFSVTLNQASTLANPSNLVDGTTYLWHINQDATGGRTLAYGTTFKFPFGTTPAVSTGASAKDTLSCVYDGAILRCNLLKGFA